MLPLAIRWYARERPKRSSSLRKGSLAAGRSWRKCHWSVYPSLMPYERGDGDLGLVRYMMHQHALPADER